MTLPVPEGFESVQGPIALVLAECDRLAGRVGGGDGRGIVHHGIDGERRIWAAASQPLEVVVTLSQRGASALRLND